MLGNTRESWSVLGSPVGIKRGSKDKGVPTWGVWDVYKEGRGLEGRFPE